MNHDCEVAFVAEPAVEGEGIKDGRMDKKVGTTKGEEKGMEKEEEGRDEKDSIRGAIGPLVGWLVTHFYFSLLGATNAVYTALLMKV